MPSTITAFDATEHHIYTFLDVQHPHKRTRHRFKAIIDTGAPCTEFVDIALVQAGIIDISNTEAPIQPDLQSQKYGKITFPKVEICGQTIHDCQSFVSRWNSEWGIGALIGLDFFRRFEVKINYKKAQITVEPL